MTLTGKVAVITGGSIGLGKALAERLRADGNTVVTLSRTAEDNNKNSFRCDVSDADCVKSVFERIGNIYNKIDLLVNNAGFGQSGAIELIEAKQLKYITETNFLGVVYCVKYALPYMGKGAKILNISSMSAFVPMPFRTMYSATKSAVNSFTYGMTIELVGTDIQITSICLGDIQTEFASRRQIIEDTSSHYGNRIAEVDRFVEGRPMSKKLPLNKATDRLCGIASKKKLYPIYIIGQKYRLAYALNKIMPIRLLMKIVNKAMR